MRLISIRNYFSSWKVLPDGLVPIGDFSFSFSFSFLSDKSNKADRLYFIQKAVSSSCKQSQEVLQRLCGLKRSYVLFGDRRWSPTFLGLLVGLLVMSSTSVRADVASAIKMLESGDVSGSVKEFQAAFEAGDPDGAFYIGRLFEMGLGTDKDMRRAAQLYAAAASKQSAKAQNRLGLMHLNGEFVLQDYQRAAELICASADAGDANGQFNCGLLYQDGKGVSRDQSKAVSYWDRAAEQNNVAAMNFLGQAYLSGKGVKQDPAKAVTYFSKTAAAGNPMGLYELAKAYQTGAGLPKDLVLAHAYANLAAIRSMEGAADLRNNLEKQLKADELVKAQEFARTWKAVPLDGDG